MREQRIIIFDSPDGTGKSNIAQGLSIRTGIPYFKMNTEHQNWRSGRFKDALEFDQTYLLQFLKQTNHSVIIDRAYPAEWVYSRVFGRETNDPLLRRLDEEFSALGTDIVIPLRHDYSRNRQDELVPNHKLNDLHRTYLDFHEWSKCKTHLLFVDDYNDNLLKELNVLQDTLLIEDM